MPMMPFIGVRISWLMFARNSVLDRLADSATSLAFCASNSARRRSATSACSNSLAWASSEVRSRMRIPSSSCAWVSRSDTRFWSSTSASVPIHSRIFPVLLRRGTARNSCQR